MRIGEDDVDDISLQEFCNFFPGLVYRTISISPAHKLGLLVLHSHIR